MPDNVNTTRTSHRKTFSFLPSSWFAPKLPLQPAGQRSTDSVPHVSRVEKSLTSTAPQADPSHPKEASSPASIPSPSTSSSLLSPKPHIQRQGMKLARKVKKLAREGSENDKPKQRRRVGDMLEDPYSLMTMSPGLLTAPPAASVPSPSPSQTSFAESEHHAGSLKRSATIGNQPKSLSAGASIQRARSIGVFQSGPPTLAPFSATEFGERSLSPVVFAPREETSQPQSETSSAFYSESLIPSKAPSLIQEEEEAESPLSDVPTTAASQRFRNVSSDSKSHARLASSASSLAKAAKLLGAAQDPHIEDGIPSHHPRQEPSASSSSSQLAPPLIRRRSPSPHGISLREGDLLTTPPQRTMSLRRAQGGRPASRRRLSLDLRTLSPEPFKAGPARLKKSRSALASVKRETKPDTADELVDSYLDEDSGKGEPVDEKEHALNVRRAKKMMQLFGDKPPKELFQVHAQRTREDTLDTISILTTVSENRRESRATFTSVSSSLSITRRLRDSVQSSNSEPPSPLVFSAPDGSVESKHDAPEETKEVPAPEPKPEPRVETVRTKPPAEPTSPAVEESSISPTRRSVQSRPGTPASPRPFGPRPRPSLASLTHSRSSSHSRQHSQHSLTFTSEPVPPLPLPMGPRSPVSAAPFSDLLPTLPAQSPPPADVDELDRERQAAASPPPEDFRARRIRAAKLSRFFGVAPHDLTEALANPPASPTFASPPQWATAARSVPSGRPKTPRQDMLTSFGSAKDSSSTPSLPLQNQPEEGSQPRERPSITVEVAAEVPRPFRLGREKKPVQELDMEAVLDQLRRMR